MQCSKRTKTIHILSKQTLAHSRFAKIIYQNCGEDLPIRASGRMQIVRASELPPPLLSSFEIIIV